MRLLTIIVVAASAVTCGTNTAWAEEVDATVMLHVTSPRPVTVQREDTGEIVCASPCNRPVPLTARYRINGTRPSEPFVLDARSGTAKISVDPASSAWFWRGIGALGVGAALGIGGAALLSFGVANRHDVPGPDGTETDTTYTDTIALGTVLVVAGTAAALWGGATAFANRRTSVNGNIMKEPPLRGAREPQRGAGSHLPWPSRSLFVPILQGAF